jgi:hypothetical protein
MCSRRPKTTRGPEGDARDNARRALRPVTSLPQSLCRQFATAATMMRPISAAMQMKPMTDATLTVLCVLLIPFPQKTRSGVAVSGLGGRQTWGPREDDEHTGPPAFDASLRGAMARKGDPGSRNRWGARRGGAEFP